MALVIDMRGPAGARGACSDRAWPHLKDPGTQEHCSAIPETQRGFQKGSHECKKPPEGGYFQKGPILRAGVARPLPQSTRISTGEAGRPEGRLSKVERTLTSKRVERDITSEGRRRWKVGRPARRVG